MTREAHVTWTGASLQVNDPDPPCSPRGKWSLVATKVGPGGLDRAGATPRLTNRSRTAIPVPGLHSVLITEQVRHPSRVRLVAVRRDDRQLLGGSGQGDVEHAQAG